MSDWLLQLKNAKKTCLVENNLKKVHYDLASGQELVEEYNTDTNVLTRRAWKRKTELRNDDQWNIEIGDPEPVYNKEESILIKENSTQPFVSRRYTRNNMEWRIRNLSYPIETYSVTVDPDDKCLVVRTSNRKYFKKLFIPDLERIGLRPEQQNVSFTHKFNTLIINYKKPIEFVEFEKQLWSELKSLKSKDQPMDCKPNLIVYPYLYLK